MLFCVGYILMIQARVQGSLKKMDNCIMWYLYTKKQHGGTVSSVNFQICYDSVFLEPLRLENGSSLDLKEKGFFTETIIKEYNNSSWDVKFNDSKCIYNGTNNDLKAIEEKEVKLLTICFKVKDNIKQKRSVYIDTQSEFTDILYADLEENIRYITNGIEVNDGNNSLENKNIQDDIGKEYTNEKINNIDNHENSMNLANKILPQTGQKIGFIAIIFLMLCIIIFIYVKIKNINDMKK